MGEVHPLHCRHDLVVFPLSGGKEQLEPTLCAVLSDQPANGFVNSPCPQAAAVCQNQRPLIKPKLPPGVLTGAGQKIR